MQYQTDAPVSVAMRWWSPFLPGDAQTSMLPGIVFEFTLSDTSAEEEDGSLAYSFSGFELPVATEESAGAEESVIYEELDGTLNGLHIVSPHTGNS